MGAKNVEEKDVRLDEEELRKISGGAVKELCNPRAVKSAQPHFCIKCNKTTSHNVFSGGRMVCSVCGTTPTM